MVTTEKIKPNKKDELIEALQTTCEIATDELEFVSAYTAILIPSCRDTSIYAGLVQIQKKINSIILDIHDNKVVG